MKTFPEQKMQTSADMRDASSSAFRGILPKTSTQALAFIKQNPEYDGRGVVIAIFDTGVDPGAAGLQVCPDGSPKILDLHDCTGAGDVVMKEKRVAETDLDTGKDVIVGLTGKKLLLNPDWKNPTKEYRVGIKAMYEVFPEPLVTRMRLERKAQWEREQNAAEVLANRTTTEDPKLKKEYEERANQLKGARDGYSDPGPIVDIVSFLDEEGMWRIVVDSSESGDLSNVEEPLTIFRAERKYATWDAKTQLNYAFNVYENGDIVSIVMDSGSHGTHVAGIAAGYHGPDQPELNGVAPGAQIISMKIGDIRLGGMETGTGVIRALTAAAAAGVDIINMSFGEPSKSGGAGRIVELCRQIVLKHHIIFVSSAGNSGPALSTAGAPGGSTPHLIGVGAYVETEMMTAEYAMRTGETPPATQYTWSSRGPTFDGQLGVSITAPGGAIACVPTWTLSGKQLMNGTSMSSPNAAGGIALILSALKAQGLPRSPARIRRALEATAIEIPGVEAFAQGHGLIQVQSALECAKIGRDDLQFDLPFDVRITSRQGYTNSGFAHGLYLREPTETNLAQEHMVEVTPVFATDVDDPDVGFNVVTKTTRAQQVQFEVRVTLDITNGGSRWVRVPSAILLNSKPTSFRIFVDPTVLPKGSASFCEVVGYDEAKGKAAGALFRIPVTVIRPEVAMDVQPTESLVRTVSSSPLLYDPVARFPNIRMEPGIVLRKFLQVPSGATWCDVRVINEQFNPEDRMFVLHCLQVRPQSRFRDDEVEAFVRLGGDVGASINRAVKVWGGGTLEVCLAPYWSALGMVQVTLEVQFGGITVNPGVLSLGPHNGFVAQAGLRADLKDVRVEPSGELTRWITPIAPVKAKTKLEPRFPESRNSIMAAYPPDARPTWELKLWYEFQNSEKCKFMPKLPLRINDSLYESPLESQLTIVFDSNKKILAVTDYGHTQKNVEIEKGQVTVVCIIRHEKKQVLDKLKDLNLLIDRQLSSNLSLQAFTTPTGPAGGAFKFEARILKRGYETNAFFAINAGSMEDLYKKLPGGCKPGDVLTGTVQFLKKNKDQTAFGSDDKPDGYPVCLVLPAKPAAVSGGDDASSASDAGKSAAPAEEEQWLVPLLKSKLKILEAVTKDDLFDKEFAGIDSTISALTSSSNRAELDLAARLLVLRRAVKKFRAAFKAFETEDQTSDAAVQAALGLVIDAAEQVRASVDIPDLEKKKLAPKVGIVDGEIQERDAKGDKDVKTRTDALCEALYAKAHAILDVDSVINPSTPPSITLIALVDELARWTSDQTLSFQQLKLRFTLRAGKMALALPLLDKLLQEDDADLQKLPSPETKKELHTRKIELLEELGWKHLADLVRANQFMSAPSDYPLF